MKAFTLSLIIIFFGFTGYCQQKESEFNVVRPSNLVSINYLGDLSLLSANYERLFGHSEVFFMSFKIGLGYNRQKEIWDNIPGMEHPYYLTIPHHFTFNLGKNKGYFEIGLAGTAFNGDSPDWSSGEQKYTISPLLGYRFLTNKPHGVGFRFYFYLPLTKEMEVQHDMEVQYYLIGINIGYAF